MSVAERVLSALSTFVDKASGYFLAPFQSSHDFVTAVTGAVTAFTALQSKTGWLYILTSFAIGGLVYQVGRRQGWIRTSLRRFLFPREVYLHRSAVLDYKFTAVDLTLAAFIQTPIVTGVFMVVFHATGKIVGDLPSLRPHMSALLAGSILVPIVILLVADFILYWAHRIMHQIPELWCFHQVHHAAEVLTPVTVWREHPVGNVLWAVLSGSFTGVGAAIYTGQTGAEVTLPTILGVNAVQFLFYAFASQLRHSHVWLSYGPVLSWILISPAQHQIHHSRDQKHYDRNFGYIFAFWDGIFGSLYVPKTRETLEFGLTGVDQSDFSTVPRLYFLPFRRAGEIFWKRFQRQPFPRTVEKVV
jgi:sterol desaturase/sphingolipid hydroxylase (fatty acid hydroxylase superfamily)